MPRRQEEDILALQREGPQGISPSADKVWAILSAGGDSGPLGLLQNLLT